MLSDVAQTHRIVLWVFAAQVTDLVVLFAGAPARGPAYLVFVDQPPVPLLAWLLAVATVVAYTPSAATTDSAERDRYTATVALGPIPIPCR